MGRLIGLVGVQRRAAAVAAAVAGPRAQRRAGLPGGESQRRSPVGIGRGADRGVRDQAADQLGGARALLRPTGERCAHQRGEFRRHAGDVGWSVLAHPGQHVGLLGGERRMSRRRVRHAGAPGEHVGGGPGPFPAQLLGRHPGQRANENPGPGVAGDPRGPRDAEVDDLRAVPGQQDVRGREVAVHHSGGMDGDQRVGESHAEAVQQPFLQPAVAQHRVGEVGALHVFGRQPRRRGLGIGIEHRRDRPAVHPAGGGHLAAEPFPEFGVVSEPGVGNLHRGGPAVGVETEVHGAHAASADPVVDRERADVARVVVNKRGQHRAACSGRRARSCARRRARP